MGPGKSVHSPEIPAPFGSFRKLGVPSFGVRIIRIEWVMGTFYW